MRISEEEELTLLRWLLGEIIKQVKKSEKRGERNLKFLTKTKLQKMLFLVSEDFNLDLTRSWYMFGGMVLAPFNLNSKAKSYYYNQECLTNEELLEVERILGRRYLKKVSEYISDKFEGLFYRKTEDFLDNFYEERSPAKFKGMYQSFRSLLTLYNQLISTHYRLDYMLRKLIPTFNPWKDATKFQKNISMFTIEAAGILDEESLALIMDYTRLMEKTLVKLSWLKNSSEKITNYQNISLTQLRIHFIDVVWKIIATNISIETIKGIRADQIKRQLIKKQSSLKKNLNLEINNQKSILAENDLLPNVRILQEFFNSEYGEMFEEAMGVKNEIENQDQNTSKIFRN